MATLHFGLSVWTKFLFKQGKSLGELVLILNVLVLSFL